MKRLRSLDAFRGLTVAAMVLVNSPGGDEVFAPLRHADWNGWTPTDLIFPSFLAVMGVSAAISAASRRARGVAPTDSLRRILLRAAVLIGLGILVNEFIYRGTAGVRFPGVLQRIALCYLGVEAFLALDAPRAEPFAAAGLLLLHWLVLTRVPVPGGAAGVLTPDGNLSYWLDGRLFGGHLLVDRWGDPEGLLPTLSALATAMMGLSAGRLLVRDGPPAAGRIGAWGLAAAAAGAAWGSSLPMNKHLWTGSYALFAGGLALAGLALTMRAVEGRAARWAAPFEALGRRALAAYLLAGFAYGIQESVPMTLPGGAAGNLKLWLTARLFAPWTTARGASLAYAAAFTALAAAAALLVAKRLDRREQ